MHYILSNMPVYAGVIARNINVYYPMVITCLIHIRMTDFMFQCVLVLSCVFKHKIMLDDVV